MAGTSRWRLVVPPGVLLVAVVALVVADPGAEPPAPTPVATPASSELAYLVPEGRLLLRLRGNLHTLAPGGDPEVVPHRSPHHEGTIYSLSPDGSVILSALGVSLDREPWRQERLVTIDPSSGDETELVELEPGVMVFQLDWDITGNAVGWIQGRMGPEGGFEDHDTCIASIRERVPRCIPYTGGDFAVALSEAGYAYTLSDGKSIRIIAAVPFDTGDRLDMTIVTRDDPKLRDALAEIDFPARYGLSSPLWSPSGSLLAATAAARGRSVPIIATVAGHLWSVGRGDEVLATTWLDSDRLVFLTGISGSVELHVLGWRVRDTTIAVDTTRPRRGASLASSPSARWVAAVHSGRLWIVNLDGNEAARFAELDDANASLVGWLP